MKGGEGMGGEGRGGEGRGGEGRRGEGKEGEQYNMCLLTCILVSANKTY